MDATEWIYHEWWEEEALTPTWEGQALVFDTETRKWACNSSVRQVGHGGFGSMRPRSNGGASQREFSSASVRHRLQEGSFSYKSPSGAATPRMFARSSLLGSKVWFLQLTIGSLTCLLSFGVDFVMTFVFGGYRSLLKLVFDAAYRNWSSAAVAEMAALFAFAFVASAIAGIGHIFASRSPKSFGSGIPELRCVLQGVHLSGFFRSSVLWAKLGGLALAQAALLPIGKEGPFAHIAAVMSIFLSTVHPFREVQRITGLWRQLLIVSVASASCCVFGAPVGGVCFALEVMPDASWETGSYWACLWAAVAGGFVLRVLSESTAWLVNVRVSMLPTVPQIPRAEDLQVQLTLIAVLLGAVCGALGGIFVQLHIRLGKVLKGWIAGNHKGESKPAPLQRKTTVRLSQLERQADLIKPLASDHSRSTLVSDQSKRITLQGSLPLLSESKNFASSPSISVLGTMFKQDEELSPVAASTHDSRNRLLILCVCVAAFNALVCYCVPLFRGTTELSVVWSLMKEHPQEPQDLWCAEAKASTSSGVPCMPHDAVFVDLPPLCFFVLACAARWLLTSLALALPVPSGCVAPLYVVGALLGRAFKEFLGCIVHYEPLGHLNAELALVGATAFTGGVCRSFSVVIAVFELVDMPRGLVLPLSFSALVAIHVAKQFGPSIFEAGALSKQLPSLPEGSLLEDLESVSAVMREDVQVVPECCGNRESRTALLRKLSGCADDECLGYAIVAGGVDDMDSAPLIGFAPLELVRAVLDDKEADAEGSSFSGTELMVAPQVPPNLPVKYALLIFEYYACPMIFITESGRILGCIGYEELRLHAKEQRLRRRETWC